jgi:large subunit ribosomal protein L23
MGGFMKKDLRKIIRRPLITERASQLQEESNKHLFEVRGDANKIEIKRAVEEIFEVEVVKVNTTSVRGKLKRLGRFQGRRSNWKKAIVTLAEGQRIDFYEGV